MHFIFDLDGTLSDPYAGVAAAFRYSLGKMEHPAVARDHFRDLIGPPLTHIFDQQFGLKEEAHAIAIDLFREYYNSTGWCENELFEGIPALLQTLHANGSRLSVVTNKPEVLARRILAHFEVDVFFSDIIGQQLSYHSVKKAELLDALLQRTGKENTWYVGDTCHDIEASRSCGIPVIAVGYGFGQHEELLLMAPEHFAVSVSELQACTGKIFRG